MRSRMIVRQPTPRQIAPHVGLHLGPLRREQLHKALQSKIICIDHESFSEPVPKEPWGSFADFPMAGLGEFEIPAFLAMNHWKKITIDAMESLKARPLSHALAEKIADAHANAMTLRSSIIVANGNLVIGAYTITFGDSVPEDARQDGMVCLCNLVDRFDASRGWKFSTYAYRGLYRDFARSGKKEAAQQCYQLETGNLPDQKKTTEDPALVAQKLLSDPRCGLTETEVTIIKKRYGLGFTPAKGYTEIGVEMKISRTKVKILRRSAILKLQSVAIP